MKKNIQINSKYTFSFLITMFFMLNVYGQCDEETYFGKMKGIQGGYHTTMVTVNNEYYIFGNRAAPNGSSNNLYPVSILPANGYNYTGTLRMATLGSYSYAQGSLWSQYFALTTTGLYAWGQRGEVIPTDKTTNNTFQLVVMPSGVNSSDVQQIVAGNFDRRGSLMFRTVSGEIWVLANTGSGNAEIRGAGGTGTASNWTKVLTSASTPLTGMVEIISAGRVAFATDGNNFFTWGIGTRLGNGSAAANRNFATQMTAPPGFVYPIKQIDLSMQGNIASYYALDSNGVVHVLGRNNYGQLGLGNNVDQSSWTTITTKWMEPNTAGNQADVSSPVGKIRFISANNHDTSWPILAVIDDNDQGYAAGYDHTGKIGINGQTSQYNLTAYTQNNGGIIWSAPLRIVEAGGHISIVVTKLDGTKFYYTGDTVQGSDGCNGCTGGPTEFKVGGFEFPGIIGCEEGCPAGNIGPNIN